MTNEQNFKKGDKVRHIGFNLCGIITDFLGEGFVKVKAIDDEVFSTWDINNLELYDRRIDFLRRLGALLREYDAKIYGGLSDIYDEDVLYIQVGIDRIAYRNGKLNVCYPHITADNIMEFDKE